MIFWDTEALNVLNGLERKKFLNKKRIVKYLYRMGSLSSAEITKILHLSAPTTMQYLNELVEDGKIEHRGKGESMGGRRPAMFGLKKNSVYVLGIDIGRKNLSIAIFNNELEKVSSTIIRVDGIRNDKSLIRDIYDKTLELFSKTDIDLGKVMGVGISMPGLINSETGINYTYLNFGDQPLTELFAQLFKRPVFLENDAKARTLAEMRYGSARDLRNVLVLQLEWGLGLGMVLNGKLYKGVSGLAGELSHILIDPDGVQCICGRKGCLETLASGNALVRYCLENIDNHPESPLYKEIKTLGQQITHNQIVEAAINGDKFAITQVHKVGEALGKGISYLIQILNPELIILGGTVSQAGEHLLVPLRHSLHNHCLNKLREDARIILSDLGQDAGVLGAAAVVIEHALDDV
jgi:glucokinase-like ROK family protein